MGRDTLVQVWIDADLTAEIDAIATRFATNRTEVARQAIRAAAKEWKDHPSPFPVKQPEPQP